jgi:antitoxin YefM
MSTTVLPVTLARRTLLDLIEKVDHTLTRYVITKKGEPKALLMSYEEFEGWLETLDILTDAEWVKALDQAKREAKKGKFLPFEKVVGRKQKRIKSQKIDLPDRIHTQCG